MLLMDAAQELVGLLKKSQPCAQFANVLVSNKGRNENDTTGPAQICKRIILSRLAQRSEGKIPEEWKQVLGLDRDGRQKVRQRPAFPAPSVWPSSLASSGHRTAPHRPLLRMRPKLWSAWAVALLVRLAGEGWARFLGGFTWPGESDCKVASTGCSSRQDAEAGQVVGGGEEAVAGTAARSMASAQASISPRPSGVCMPGCCWASWRAFQ